MHLAHLLAGLANYISQPCQSIGSSVVRADHSTLGIFSKKRRTNSCISMTLEEPQVVRARPKRQNYRSSSNRLNFNVESVARGTRRSSEPFKSHVRKARTGKNQSHRFNRPNKPPTSLPRPHPQPKRLVSRSPHLTTQFVAALRSIPISYSCFLSFFLFALRNTNRTTEN